MKSCYMESSALLAWLGGEPTSAKVATAMNKAQRICTSRLTFIECDRCLLRAEALGLMNRAELHKRQGWLGILEAEWEVMEVSQEVQKGARTRFPIEPVRSLDAIHLASALQFQIVYHDLGILSFDARILQNLVPLGLKSWD